MKKRILKYIVGAVVIAVITAALGVDSVGAASKTKSNVESKADLEAESDTIGLHNNNKEYIYCVGSVSKVYVTAAVMKLVDEGKVSLDAPVVEYIPDFKMADERYKDITVRMLMDHTSGIMGTSQIGSFMFDDGNSYYHDHLVDTLSKQRLKAEPGRYAAYCNDGFDLLELIVENISGMSYTDYVVKMVAGPTGGIRSGTNLTYVHDKDRVPAYSPDNILYDNESCMCLGSGGVYSTASDVAKFGASFFKGNNSLLTDESKEEMAVRWNDDGDDYKDESGLGWDYVSMNRYEDAGVKVEGKGGDVMLNHAFLMVAPDEEISISVLSNGGSSMYNGMLAETLMDTILNERGISVEDPVREFKAVKSVPLEYDDYEGYYTVQNALEGGAVISRISFPGHRYMHVENISPVNTTVTDYAYVDDGKFAELAYEVEDADMKIAVNPKLVSFVKDEAGSVYLTGEMRQSVTGLGIDDRKTYMGEKIGEALISDEAARSWERVCGRDLVLYNDVYSSANYQNAYMRMYMCDEVPGYIFALTGQGSRLLKIEDKGHASAFQTIPSSSNRDLIDLELKKDKDGLRIVSSSGTEYICTDSVPEFDSAVNEVDFSDSHAVWYRIGDDIAGTFFDIGERPDNSAVYIYNKYGEAVYTTHIRDCGNEFPLPKGGMIVFLGEKGGKIKLEG